MPAHVVLDATAMLAIGRGNLLGSRLIVHAGQPGGPRVYAPTCALVEADRIRRGVAEHIASLPGVLMVDLDLSAALAVARDETWAAAHIRHTAGPMPHRPVAAVVATAAPENWEGERVELMNLAA
ncbi:hypothetical protein [Frankia sp. R82]|uniref:hypothetical protein n=1 Tax=Frankia sp. R82 TaxID=2950553 RepID=UPI00255A855D|nr:hypothetical protein [Frankia sp. R82]